MSESPSFCFKNAIWTTGKLTFLIFAFFTFLLGFGLAPSPAVAKDNPKYASIVMDADTGLILHQRHADKKLHPASLTKVMTLLMVFEALDQGKITLDDRMRVSKHAAGMAPSKLDLKAGSTIKVKDGIYALVTKSANDVAAVFAEHLGGTESGFARLMTVRAHELGMTKTTFKNASGLHNPGQISSARDMARLARYVITHHPEQYRYFSTKNFSYQGRSYHNHNRLMESYKGMDGMKTGFIQPSGFNLVASAVRNNHRLIGVVFGGRSTQSRNAHMANLLDNGFAKLGGQSDVLMASADVEVDAPVAVKFTAKAPPIPPRKPGILLAMNALNSTAPAAGSKPLLQALVPPAPEPIDSEAALYGKIIGEGDYDPAATGRIETGLVAVAAQKSQSANDIRGVVQKAALSPAAINTKSGWAIQVGAFTSRAATDKALHETLKKLPEKYAGASPVIAPLRTGEGWLYRARVSGFSKAEAFGACRYVKDCLPVAPQNN